MLTWFWLRAGTRRFFAVSRRSAARGSQESALVSQEPGGDSLPPKLYATLTEAFLPAGATMFNNQRLEAAANWLRLSRRILLSIREAKT